MGAKADEEVTRSPKRPHHRSQPGPSAWRSPARTSKLAPASSCARATQRSSIGPAPGWPLSRRMDSRSWRGLPTSPAAIKSSSWRRQHWMRSRNCTFSSTTRASTARLERSKRSIGTNGSGRLRSTSSDRFSCVARCCRTSRRTDTERSCSCRAAERQTRFRGSARTRRRRRRSSVSPRRSPNKCAARGSTSTRLRPALSTPAFSTRSWPPVPNASAMRSTRRSMKQKTQGGAPLDRGASLAVFLASPASETIARMRGRSG